MPKPRTITHCGTAQIFKGRIPMPPKREELVLEDGQIIRADFEPEVKKEEEE